MSPPLVRCVAHLTPTPRRQEGGRWQAAARQLAAGPASRIPAPDCSGFLIRLGFKWRDWTRLYCVLKDGVLFFYRSDADAAAFGERRPAVAVVAVARG